jgi:hippurate hydrolase
MFLNAMQTVVARNISPADAVVVTAGAFHAGQEEAYNVIPDTARINLSVRTLSNESREIALSRIRTIAIGIGAAMNVDFDLEHHEISPVTVNDPAATKIAEAAALEVFGEDEVRFGIPPIMNSEDFAFMALERPSAYALLGAHSPAAPHQSGFDFDDALIVRGAAYLARVTENYLKAV